MQVPVDAEYKEKMLQSRRCIPCFRVRLALQDGKMLKEELDTLAGLLDNGAIHTGHSWLHTTTQRQS